MLNVFLCVQIFTLLKAYISCLLYEYFGFHKQNYFLNLRTYMTHRRYLHMYAYDPSDMIPDASQYKHDKTSNTLIHQRREVRVKYSSYNCLINTDIILYECIDASEELKHN